MQCVTVTKQIKVAKLREDVTCDMFSLHMRIVPLSLAVWLPDCNYVTKHVIF